MSSKRLRILAARVFDSVNSIFVVNQSITVSRKTGLILDVRQISTEDETPDAHTEVLDLRPENITLIPGLIDTHVHMFLHPYSETSWTDQVTRESTIERTIRATAHARSTLMAGYTTVRDLGTEGAEDADVALRKCISGPNAIIPGPRLFTASRAIVATGSYGPKGDLRPNAEGVDGKFGAEAVDGEVECRKAVRRQIATGADWVKIYADYPFRSRANDTSPKKARTSLPLFTRSELQIMIDTAHALGVKVAAHAVRSDTISVLINLGIDSIEHGELMDKATLQLLKSTKGRVTWNPTLATFSRLGPYSEVADQSRKTFQEAMRVGGVKIACGGDTGTFAHGKNALEMLMMIEYGADWRDVLQWATYGGWECVRSMDWEGEQGRHRLDAFANASAKAVQASPEDEEDAFKAIGEWPLGDNDVPLGAIKAGFAADIVGMQGDLLIEGREGFVEAFGGSQMDGDQKVSFVMKAGRMYKMNNRELSMPL